MYDLKNQSGIVSIILLFIIILLMTVLVYFSLDVFGVINVPKEYSFTRFIDSAMVESEDEIKEEKSSKNTTNKTVVKKKVKKVTEDEYDTIAQAIIPSTSAKRIESQPRSSRYTDEVFEYKRFYYSQLESGSRKIYNKIINNLDLVKTGTYTLDFGKDFDDILNTEGGDEILNEYFQSALNAILLDNPELFYLDITKMYLQTQSTTYNFSKTTYEVSIGPQDEDNYLLDGFDEDNVAEAEDRINNIKEEIIENVEGSDIVKIKYVHDYLVDNLEYDSEFTNGNRYNIYGALVDNQPVCEGYAKAFKTILDELRIPCVVVCGSAQNSKGEIESHAWNYVLVDDLWYAIDVTWDDPIIIGKGDVSKSSRYKYYMKGAISLFKDHTENGNVVEGANFVYPELNRADY